MCLSSDRHVQNVTGSVSPESLKHFRECCRIAATVLEQGTPLPMLLSWNAYPPPPVLAEKAPRRRKMPHSQPQNQPPHPPQAAKPSASGSAINGNAKETANPSHLGEQSSVIPRRPRNKNANAKRSKSH